MLETGDLRRNLVLSHPFPTFHKHIITQPKYTNEDIRDLLAKNLNPSVINGTFTTEDIMGQIQNLSIR